MFTSVFHAKISTHTLTLVVAVLAFAAHRFFSDPQAAEWLRAHWVARDIYETAGAVLVVYGIYKQPTEKAA